MPIRKSQIAILGTVLILFLIITGCARDSGTSTSGTGTDNSAVQIDKKTVNTAGSTALQPLVKVAATEFMAQHPEVQVNISGGGSMTGLNNVANGSIDIGNSDVVVPPELEDKGLVDHQVAVAPFLLIVSKDVPVDNLSKEQLANIFTGKITNWKDVDGQDKKITIIGRAASSGTRLTIKKIILDNAEFSKDAVTVDSTGNLITGIEQTPGSIGYIDAAYMKDTVKALKFNGVAYSVETVTNGQYPIYAYEHMYTKGEPTGTIKAFLDYILSADFQNNFVEKSGFIPISKIKK
jgi:phosphate transport system substrate-binding protein